jgi:hypothetical protein
MLLLKFTYMHLINAFCVKAVLFNIYAFVDYATFRHVRGIQDKR